MKETLEILNRMQRDGIIKKYAIGGAVAAIYYLEPSSTLDIDVFVNLSSSPGTKLLTLAPVYEYLKSMGCRIEKEYIIIGKWPVQFLAPAGTLEEEALEKAVLAKVNRVGTWIMTAEHLVAIALKTGRPKDIARILQFLEAKAVNARKLKRVLLRHGLSAQWDAFEKKHLRQ